MNLSRRIKKALSRLIVIAFCISGYASAQQTGKAAAKTSSTKTDPLAEARSQFAHGDLQAAEASVWVVLSANPDQEPALALLGGIRLRQQRLAEADALFRRVLQIDPKSVETLEALGNTLVAESEPEKALEQFVAALELAPQDQALRVETARLYAGQGQCEKALAALHAIPQNRFPADAVPVRASCSLTPGNGTDASSFSEQAKASPSAEIDLAEVFLNAKLPDQALHSLDLAVTSLKRKPARFYYLRGRALQAMNQPEKALTSLNEALAADPKFVDPLVAISELQADEQKHAEAVASLQKALAIAPQNVIVLRHLVVEATKASTGRISVDAASALSEKSPNNPDDLDLAGAALLEENSAGASVVLEKYVALRADNAKAWLGLGIAYVQQKRFAEAGKPLERSVELDPSLAEGEYQLGVVAKAVSTSEEAIKHFQRAVELQPKHAKALWGLGNLYLQAGDLAKAQESLQQAEAIDPYSPETEYDLALALTRQGKPDMAREHFARYKNLKGEQPPASRDGH
jgi:tetratricopeptide (TPR) repeat protein